MTTDILDTDTIHHLTESGETRGWVDRSGEFWPVDWHRDLDADLPTGEHITGYGAHEHGWMRVWTITTYNRLTASYDDGREFGYELAHEGPSVEQVRWLLAVIAATEVGISRLAASDRGAYVQANGRHGIADRLSTRYAGTFGQLSFPT